MNTRHDEAAFEFSIETALLTTGWQPLDKSTYDRTRHCFPQEALAFIRATQAKEWARLETLNGAQTEAQVLKDLVHWLDTHGTLAVLRNGFKCQGRTLRLAFFKPAHGMNPELAAQYAANRLGVTRQLRYSQQNTNELDLVLSVNGLPVATAELKNPMTGQTVEHAQAQYRQDRDHREPLFEFKRRALVHFAVDTEQVFMTTRLAGGATHFLPFNQGHAGGAGNPPEASGQQVRTAYLWQEVWARDSWLDILGRFMHLQVEEKKGEDGRRIRKETLVFPRYHQLQAVRELEAAARAEGPGHNYLVEHSAGSGKSNTIAWLAHRLASLHDAADAKVFDSVIVITDRRVLDKQLQDTIYQFEHRQGVVQKIDDDSRQLAQALTGGVPIIISTLQKFPFVTRQLLKMAEERGTAGDGVLPTKRCAVIVDEAHSSQSGESATDLKEVLGGQVLREQAAAYAAEEGVQDLDELYRSMAKRGQQANISFFAFTATPKHKTLAVFGRERAGQAGQAFHRYTMRQAIEEGFIMDVLQHYTTYATYYQLLKAGEDDPQVERKQAAKALARFMRLHPYNIAQKTEVMVEHFNAATRHKLGGKAKAMVVTGSRLEAVRYKRSFDSYIRAKGYGWIKTLVAFSGEVMDDELPGQTFTEVGLNGGIKEAELPEQFDSPSYQVLLVAEKYQTGFDQPLLHTMYVDKRLAGIQAVQTLSRLNRMHPLKEDTFVLDFVNDREEIRAAFQQFYDGAVMGEAAEPHQMYAIKAELDASGIYLQDEVERFVAVYFKPRERQSPADHNTMNAALDPAVDRFTALMVADTGAAELWRSKLNAFRNLYAFLSQVIPYQDSDLEKLYTFLRLLSPKLPTRGAGPGYSFDDEVRLAYYRLQKISEGSISLRGGKADLLDGPRAVGSGLARDEEVPLSRLIDVVNERFGTDFTGADQLFFDQIIEAAIQEDSLRQAAAVNPEDKFALLFSGVLDTLFIERMEQNEDIFARFMNESDFKRVVADWVARAVYGRLRRHLGAGELPAPQD
jgi:type I restriction enzyme R subunit